MKLKYFFYILKCKDRTLYCGITNDLIKRLAAHNAGKGSAYVRSRGGGKIVYSEPCKNRGAALRREAEVKKWSRFEKLNFLKTMKNKNEPNA
jgi:putative endonuclease